MQRARKRRRPQLSTTFNIKRSLNKAIIVIAKTGIATTAQVATLLITATFPGTIVGLRWNINGRPTTGTNSADYRWAIVIVKEGQTPAAISGGDASNFYNPEQHVLTWGGGFTSPGNNQFNENSSTKTMRKLQAGDTLQFIVKNFNANPLDLGGEIQFFYKT